jgi:hypothetical protein
MMSLRALGAAGAVAALTLTVMMAQAVSGGDPDRTSLAPLSTASIPEISGPQRPASPVSPPMKPVKLWEIRGWTDPEIGRNMIYGNYFVTDDDGGVHRMRLMNGSSVWDVKLPGPVTQPFQFGDNVLTTADTFYGLKLADGSLNFSHPVRPDRPSQLYLRNLQGWYTLGDRVVMIHTENGTVQWTSPPIAPGITGPSAGDCCATAMQVYKGNRIYTVYFANGSIQYTHDMPGDIYTGKIPVFNTYIYAGDSTGTFRAVQDIDGTVGWETNLGHPVAIAPWVDRNEMFGATVDGMVYNMSVIDGKVHWTNPLPAEARTQPEMIYGHAFFGAEDGKVYGIDLATGQVAFALDLGAPARGRLASFYGVLLVPGTDRLAAYDLYPTEFRITSHTNGSYVSTARVELRGHGIDDHFLNGVQLSLDGKKWFQVGPQGISYENLGNVNKLNWNASLDLRPGWNTVHARLVGFVGTERIHFTDTVELFLDEEAPEIAITIPKDGFVTTSTKVRLAGTARDPNGLATVEASPEMSGWKQAAGLENWSVDVDLVEGTYDIAVRAVDRAGQVSIASVTVTVVGRRVDTTAPTIAVEGGLATLYRRTDPAIVSGSATDNGPLRRIDASVSGGPWRRCGGTSVWSCEVRVSAGPNQARFRAMDTYNNSAETAAVVVLDTLPPTMSITRPPDDFITNQRTLEAGGSFQDDHVTGLVVVNSSRISTVAADVQNGSWSLRFDLADGEERIRFTGLDLAGNRAEAFRNVTLDLALPRLELEYWQRSAEGIRLFGSASDDHGVARVEARGEGGEWQMATGTRSWFVTVAGTPAAVEIRVVDLAGNELSRLVATGGAPVAGALVGAAIAAVGSAGAVCAATMLMRWRSRPMRKAMNAVKPAR